MPTAPPVCPYCSLPAEKVNGAVLFPHRNDMGQKTFWRCVPCLAWVGCHMGTDAPLGPLANAELRDWKRRAHAAFDPIWRVHSHNKKKKAQARLAAYAALAKELGIPAQDCHIGMFSVDLCRRTVQVTAKLLGPDREREGDK